MIGTVIETVIGWYELQAVVIVRDSMVPRGIKTALAAGIGTLNIIQVFIQVD